MVNFLHADLRKTHCSSTRLRRRSAKDALQQHAAEKAKKRVSDGNKEQNAVPLSAAPLPNKKQKQNIPGKACDTGD